MAHEVYMIHFVKHDLDEEGNRDWESREESSVLFTSRPMIKELTDFITIPVELNREAPLEKDMMYKIGKFEVDIHISETTIINNDKVDNMVGMEEDSEMQM